MQVRDPPVRAAFGDEVQRGPRVVAGMQPGELRDLALAVERHVVDARRRVGGNVERRHAEDRARRHRRCEHAAVLRNERDDHGAGGDEPDQCGDDRGALTHRTSRSL